MKKIPAGEFKARCLRVMKEVEKYRTPVVITKKGKPVAQLVPADEEPGGDGFGCMAGTGKTAGDIEAPAFPPKAWNAMRGATSGESSERSSTVRPRRKSAMKMRRSLRSKDGPPRKLSTSAP